MDGFEPGLDRFVPKRLRLKESLNLDLLVITWIPLKLTKSWPFTLFTVNFPQLRILWISCEIVQVKMRVIRVISAGSASLIAAAENFWEAELFNWSAINEN